jgi:arylsulfatase A-like enzyme
MVLVDTLRSDHLGYHGHTRPVSPFLDQLEAESVSFLAQYSHSSRTGPSVASLFTGLHPRSHGVINPLTKWDAKGKLASEQITLAEILGKHGYHCYAVVGNKNVSPKFGFSQGFERYEYIKWGTAGQLNDRLYQMFKNPPSRPYFLYMHYMEPHSPYEAPESYHDLWVDPEYDGKLTGDHKQLDRVLKGRIKVEQDDLAFLLARYDQEILYFDDELRKLFAFLDGRALLDNTIFVFISDHGEEFLEHGGVLHGYTIYEEQIHVPLFIRWPGRVEPRRVKAVTRHVDVLPTLLELLDIQEPLYVQGTSLLPWMEGRSDAPATGPVHAMMSLRAVKTVLGTSYMSDGWKLIDKELPKEREELYHIDEDPGETHNLLRSEPDVARCLREEKELFEKLLPEATLDMIQLSEEDIEQLKALGYMQ